MCRVFFWAIFIPSWFGSKKTYIVFGYATALLKNQGLRFVEHLGFDHISMNAASLEAVSVTGADYTECAVQLYCVCIFFKELSIYELFAEKGML